MTPSDIMLKKIKLAQQPDIEAYQQFTDEMVKMLDKTHAVVIALRNKAEFKELGDMMWQRIFENKES